MRKILFLACIFALPTHIWAQKPKTYNYQIDNFLREHTLVDFQFSMETSKPCKLKKWSTSRGVLFNGSPNTAYTLSIKTKEAKKASYSFQINVLEPQIKEITDWDIAYSPTFFHTFKDTTLLNGSLCSISEGDETICIIKSVKASDKSYFFCFWVSCKDKFKAISKEELLKWILSSVIDEKARYHFS